MDESRPDLEWGAPWHMAARRASNSAIIGDAELASQLETCAFAPLHDMFHAGPLQVMDPDKRHIILCDTVIARVISSQVAT